MRLDRIACQRTPEVDALLEWYQVLALHGPPRHPRYYGQLERQNREHREWHARLGLTTFVELAHPGDRMRSALNTLWLRPTLDWCTVEHVWLQRPTVNIDRHQLRRDVDTRTAGLLQAGFERLRARRIAIESALTERGLLSVQPGGEC